MSTSIVKWIDGLSNRVSIIITTYTDKMKFVAYMVVSFITFYLNSCGSILYRCMYGCIFCIKVKIKVNCTLVQALRLCTVFTAHRGSRGIAILYRH